MFRYIIRLDDACSTMNHENWTLAEKILDKYNVKPIVGVIPDCKDDAEDMSFEKNDNFWQIVKSWQEKGWEISLHGLTHKFHDYPQKTKLFQKNIGTYTEFAGEPFEKQLSDILKGIEIMKSNGVSPTSFFAPAHTYDENTVLACKQTGRFKFISDGYSLNVFQKSGMLFIPSIFDTPHKMPFGLYTFIYHPSKMKDGDFKSLENFLSQNKDSLTCVDEVLKENKTVKNQGITGKIIENLMHLKRMVKNDA